MIVHCNVCEIDIDETEIESHLNNSKHQSNKQTISIAKNKEYGNNKSVIQLWQESTSFE